MNHSNFLYYKNTSDRVAASLGRLYLGGYAQGQNPRTYIMYKKAETRLLLAI